MILVSDNEESTGKESTRKADRDLVRGLLWLFVTFVAAMAVFVFVMSYEIQ